MPPSKWNDVIYEVETESREYNPDKNERNVAFLAYSLSLKSEVNHGKHCAVLLDTDDNVVHTFVNKKSKKNQTKKKFTVHAEAGLIDDFLKNNQGICSLSGYKIIVVRGTNLRFKTNSRPCKKCYNSMKKSGIDRVIYSMNGVENYGCIFF